MIQSALAILFLACGLSCAAESTPAQLELKLGDCIKIALEKNPLLRASTEGMIASHEVIGEAQAAYYPDIKASAGYSRWQQRAFLPAGLLPPTAPTVIGPTDDFKAQGSARILLFDSGERGARLNMARAASEISGENFNATRQDIMLRVHECFYRLAAALELKKVAAQNLARTEQHLKLASDRKAAGAAAESDVLRTKVAASEAKLDRVRTEAMVRINTGTLNTAMGIPVEISITPITEQSDAEASSDTVSSLLAKAIMCRPEIRLAQKRVEAARSAVKMAKSEYGPKVRAEGSYGIRDDSSDFEDKEYAAGVSVEIPLFSGFSTKHKVAGKKAEVAKAEAEVDAVTQAILQEVWVARSKLQEALESVQTAELRVRDAGESARMLEERYKVGACTVTDLMDAQTALARAEAGLVEASWNLRIAGATLARSTGTLLVEGNK